MLSVIRVASSRLFTTTPSEAKTEATEEPPALDVDKLKNEVESLNKELKGEREKINDITVICFIKFCKID